MQQRVLRQRAQALALGAIRAVGAAGAAAVRRRLRSKCPRELRTRSVELVLGVGLAHVGDRAQQLGVEPVHVAQQQEVAVGRAQRSERTVGGLRHAVAGALEIVLGAGGRTGGEVVEAPLAHQSIEPFLWARRLRGAREAPPAGCQRRDQAALSVAQASQHARGVGEERRLVARRERDVGLGLHARPRYRLRRRTLSTVIRPTPPAT